MTGSMKAGWKNESWMTEPFEITEREALTLSKMFQLGYDHFWSQNELTVNLQGEVVRTDKPRVRPKTWVSYMNEDEREVRRVRRK